MDTHITIPKARLVELETAEYKRKVLEAALLQAQNAAIQLAHRDTQRQAEYEDMQQTMHNMARNHALQLEAARKHEPESVPELRAEIKRLQDLLFAQGAMAEAPCFCCGYNGPGYFQVEAHPCAERHLLAMSEAG